MKTFLTIFALLCYNISTVFAEMDYNSFKEKSFSHLQILTSSHQSIWGIGDAERWDANLDDGLIWWTFSDKKVTAPLQVICTYDTNDGTLLWGWDHPSVHKAISLHAEKLKEYGKQNGISDLITRKISCSEDQAWEYVAMAVLLSDAQGAYRGPAGSTMVFFTFGEVNIEKN